jgi:methionine-rich copper-binding protein CopC
MKSGRAAIAALIAGTAMLVLVSAASAHAPIKFISWDSQTNPMHLTASTDMRAIEAAPNAFFVRVYNSIGQRVDNGDATLSPDAFSITVSLEPDLPNGTYTVEWLTTSTDGATLSGRETLTLPGSFGDAVSAEEEDHEHEEGEEHEDDDSHDDDAKEHEADEAEAGAVAPPRTGDGGLMTGGSGGSGGLGALAAAAVLVTLGGASLAYRRAR